MYLMYWSRYYCQRHWRKLLFVALVKPYFLYSIEVWFTARFLFRDRLEKLYRRCLRILLDDTRAIPSLSRVQVYCNAEMWPLLLEFQLHAASFLYSIIRQSAVPAFINFFDFTHKRQTHCTRNVSDLTLVEKTRIKHERTKASLKWWGPSLWNTIPSHIRLSNRVNLFIEAYKTHLNFKLLSDFDFTQHQLKFV